MAPVGAREVRALPLLALAYGWPHCCVRGRISRLRSHDSYALSLRCLPGYRVRVRRARPIQAVGALKYLSWGKHVALVTDGRFSGASTGACVGHVGPEALHGGPIGRVRDDDLIEIVIDRTALTGSVNLVGARGAALSPEQCAALLSERELHPDLAVNEALPEDTRLWAALQRASGGTWAGCVYDVDRIVEALEAGSRRPRP